MVKIALQVKAALENVEEFGSSGPEFKWYLKLRCSNCGEVSEKWNYVSLSEPVPAQKGHSLNHIITRCKLCSRENSLTILEDTIKPFVVIDPVDQDKFQTIVVFDCRGLEPIDFSPREGWIVRTVNNGTKFTDVDLSDGDWAGYCDKINQPISICEMEHRFERIK